MTSLTKTSSIVQPTAEEVASIRPPADSMQSDGPGLSYDFEMSQDSCVVVCPTKMITMVMVRSLDPDETRVVLSGRDLDARRLGIIVSYIGLVDDDPIIYLPSDPEADRFLFTVGSLHDVRIGIYDTSEVKLDAVMPLGKKSALMWWETDGKVSRR
jgi:hypothetical protein